MSTPLPCRGSGLRMRVVPFALHRHDARHSSHRGRARKSVRPADLASGRVRTPRALSRALRSRRRRWGSSSRSAAPSPTARPRACRPELVGQLAPGLFLDRTDLIIDRPEERLHREHNSVFPRARRCRSCRTSCVPILRRRGSSAWTSTRHCGADWAASPRISRPGRAPTRRASRRVDRPSDSETLVRRHTL